jgi:hypothetical protein
MDERILFDRIHQALDIEPSQGAYERLQIALVKKPIKPRTWQAFPIRSSKMGLRVVAVITVVVLAIAAAAAYVATHRVADEVTPADSEHAVASYKHLLSDDYNKIPITPIESTCAGNQFAACEADLNVRIPSIKQIQNDLGRFQPPGRFAVAVAQMRRHYAMQLSRINAVLAASRAHDAAGVDRAVAAVVSGRAWMDDMFNSILSSQQATNAIYLESVRNQKRSFDQCIECQNLAGQNQVTCIGSQAASCQASLASTAAQVASFQVAVASFQNAVVRYVAPNLLATKDHRLQLDLAKADTALLTMGDALSAGDQAGFNRGRISLQQAMVAINRDAADILSS